MWNISLVCIAEECLLFSSLYSPKKSKGNVIEKVIKKTSQELRMLSSVTINCKETKIVMNPGSQLSVL